MTTDYMEARASLLLEREDQKLHRLTQANRNYTPDASKIHTVADYHERLGALRCLSRDVLLRLVSNPEMVDAPAGAMAARSIALAEALLAELGKIEKGEELTEEANMMQGALFGLFRQWYYDKRAGQSEG